MSLFRELQRRSVIKIAITYAAVAWGIAQVADLVLDNFGAPDWIIRAILIVLGIGFPIALILAWAYEFTPEGIKRDEAADPTIDSAVPPTGRSTPRLTIAWVTSIVLISVFAGSLGLNVAGVREQLFGRIASGLITSIAVLPLDNLSGDPEQAYFTDGMTEALTAALGVDALLEGSVLRAGDEVRITLQLIHGPTDRHLLARSFQRELSDILALQSDVARTIADEIQVTLTPSVRERLQPVAQNNEVEGPNPQAYDAYLKGRYNFNRGGGDGFTNALRYYEEAVSLDPEFALAYAALAEVCVMGPVLFAKLRTLDDCSDAAVRAVKADPDLAEGHAALGTVRQFQWSWAESEAEYQKAIELNPNSVMAHQWYGELLRITMRLDEALTESKRAESLDPFNLMVKTMVGWSLLSQRRYDEALAQWNDVLEMEPNNLVAHFNKGLAFIKTRDVEKLLTSARRVAELHPLGEEASEVRMLIASAHAIRNEEEEALAIITEIERDLGEIFAAGIAGMYLLLGQEEEALARLEKGYEVRALDLPVTSEPVFDPLRENPRFKAIRRKIGLP